MRLPGYVWVVAVLMALLWGLHEVSRPAQFEGAVTLSSAVASTPLRETVASERVDLPHILDDQSPEWWNRVDYDLAWPDAPDAQGVTAERWALLMPRVGTRFRVLLNGSEIFNVGWHADPDRNILTGWFPHFVPLPAGLLHNDPARNVLQIQVKGQLLERSGLWPVQLGEHDTLYERYRELALWQVTGTWMMVITSALMGGMALFLWTTLRERLFLLMAAACLAHTLRLGLSVMLEPPLSFDAYFYLHRVSFTVYVAFFCLFVDELFGLRDRLVRALALGLLAVGPLWLAFMLVSQNYNHYRAWAGVLAVVAAFSLFWLVVRARWRRPFTRDQLLVVWVALFTLTTGIRDFMVVQLNFPGDADIRWMSLGGLALMFTLGWVLVQRATASAREVYRLNHSLSQIVARRESELRLAFDQLRQSEQQRAIEGERRRLMRDMHDGLGSQLVQTLNMVRARPEAIEPRQVESMIQHALEELRMTLDSLEPMEGDLPTILGTFRQRIMAALDSAGIALVWEVEEVPPLSTLDAQGVMHLFRCMQEVFANIVKHSRATRVVVRTAYGDGQVFLFVEDNGVGMSRQSAASNPGRGLGNLAIRAASLGASLRFFNLNPGTGVQFSFPTAAPSLPPQAGPESVEAR